MAALPTTRYPVVVQGQLDTELSRWRWLVKWFLAIPHLIVLVALWLTFAVLTVVAGISIAFTGRYPRGIFDFNVGVLRWTWRVQFYAFTLGTDVYPPFTLHDVADYPARLDVEYPERLPAAWSGSSGGCSPSRSTSSSPCSPVAPGLGTAAA